MKRVFLSYHFDNEIEQLVRYLHRMISSHDLEVVDGRRLAGQPLTDGVRDAIRSCDALILFFSKREGNRTNEWLQAERTMAYTLEKPFIAIIENGVQNTGPFQAMEYIYYDSENFAEPLVSISETLLKWKFKLGEMVEAFLEPDEIEQTVRENSNRDGIVEYRFLSRDMQWSGWKKAIVIPRQGGVSIYLKGVQKGAEIQIRVTTDNRIITSDSISRSLRIQVQ